MCGAYLWMVAGENFGILNDNDPRPASWRRKICAVDGLESLDFSL